MFVPGPLPRGGSLGEGELERVRQCVSRGRPWGGQDWTLKMADRLGVQFNLRNRGRPRQIEK